MYEIKRANRLSQAFVHFVTARASLFTDHRISGLPIRAKYVLCLHVNLRTVLRASPPVRRCDSCFSCGADGLVFGVETYVLVTCEVPDFENAT